MYEQNNTFLDLFLNEWGLDQSVYIFAWSMIGFGIGFLVGYTTKDIIKNDKKETN